MATWQLGHLLLGDFGSCLFADRAVCSDVLKQFSDSYNDVALSSWLSSYFCWMGERTWSVSLYNQSGHFGFLMKNDWICHFKTDSFLLAKSWGRPHYSGRINEWIELQNHWMVDPVSHGFVSLGEWLKSFWKFDVPRWEFTRLLNLMSGCFLSTFSSWSFSGGNHCCPGGCFWGPWLKQLATRRPWSSAMMFVMPFKVRHCQGRHLLNKCNVVIIWIWNFLGLKFISLSFGKR